MVSPRCRQNVKLGAIRTRQPPFFSCFSKVFCTQLNNQTLSLLQSHLCFKGPQISTGYPISHNSECRPARKHFGYLRPTGLNPDPARRNPPCAKVVIAYRLVKWMGIGLWFGNGIHKSEVPRAQSPRLRFQRCGLSVHFPKLRSPIPCPNPISIFKGARRL
jgi:hypothetical protein